MSDVFVSYKAEDRRRVRPLVEALQADGYSVWWDEQIGGGTAWRQAIEAELSAAKCVIVAWSKRSVGPEGTFVQDEATRAQQRRVYVPVTIDKVHLPLGFGEMQALPLTGWKGDRKDLKFQAVLSAVRRIVGDKPVESVAREERRLPVSRRAMVGGGTVAIAAAGGLGGWNLLKSNGAAASDRIAVLPFANLSGDPQQAYFSDGIAEELRSALSRLAGLKVVGRTSSEAVRTDDAETAASKLGVPNVLIGSVRRSPTTIRVGAQLIDGTSGMERWSDNFDRPPGDSIKIQTEIAESVAQSLSVALGSTGRASLTIGGTQNPAAQNLVLQASELMRVFNRDRWQRALQLLEAAIALDARYARAYGLKAIVILITSNRFSRSGAELASARAAAIRNARKAIEIAPRLSLGHGALAEIYRSNLQIPEAAKQYQRVMQVGGNDPDELGSYAGFLSAIGRTAEALRMANQAVALDPLNPGSYGNRARVLFGGRRYAEVVRHAAELKMNSPELFDFPMALGDSLTMLGRFEEARKVYAEEPADDPIRLAAEGVLAARNGDRTTAMAILDKIYRQYGEAGSYQYAEIHANLGQVDEAIAALERGWQIKDPGLLGMKTDAKLDPIRRDRRFAALMQKMKFPA